MTTATQYRRCLGTLRWGMPALLFGCLFLPAGLYAQSGLVAEWPLWQNSSTDSVTGVSGTLVGNATYGSSPKGTSLSPGGGYMVVSESTSISDARTWAAWVYPSYSNYGLPVITTSYYNSATGRYQIGVFGLTGSYGGFCQGTAPYQVFISSATQDLNGNFYGPCLAGTASVAANTWTHIAVTWDGNSTIQFYVNGTLDRTLSATLQPDELVGRVGGEIFYDPNGNQLDSSFNGQLYELRAYNRALSASEIQSVMVAGEGTLPAPSFSPGGGSFSSTTNVYISNSAAASGASMRYTVDGTTPSHTNGTLSTSSNTGPVAIACTTALQAIVYQTNWIDSSISSATYVISAGTVAAPTFSVAGGTYITPQTVTLSSTTSGATIRYTLDGSTPSETNGTIGTSVTISSTATLKAIAYLGCPWTDSSVTSATYTITGTVATPTFSPGAGTYSGAQTVTISTSTPGASIIYTIDGSTPSESHGAVGSVVTIRSTETLKAMAFKSAWADSAVASGTFTITGTATQPNPPTVGTPGSDSGNGMDPRRIGVRPLGSYWGAAGEEIDTTSGNLNFSLPLIKPLSRGGWGVNFSLSYNSQMWREDSAGIWLLGYDVGYGLGCMLQAGSIIPVWTNTSQIDHYLYTDSSGAEYSLSINTNGVWTSQESVYISFDTNTNRLYFADGSFWVMGSQSASGEPDAGTLYPTLIQDSNGNQITITYDVGAGSGSTNTSARITNLYGPQARYIFTWNSGHLSNIQGPLGTSQSWTFSYANQPLNSPFPPSISYGNISYLQSATMYGLNVGYSFQYDPTGTGEMTQVTTPLGGNLQWQYRSFTYGSGIGLREVQTRYMTASPGATANSWSFTHNDSADASQAFHQWTLITDAGTQTSKQYYPLTLASPAPALVVAAYYLEFSSAGSPLKQINYGYGQDPAGNVYLNQQVTILDGSMPYSQYFGVDYARDGYGNMTQADISDFSNHTTWTWVYNNSYLTDPNYTSRYVRNRLTQATVTENGTTTTLASNTYDACCLTDNPNLSYHDSSYATSFTYRGNLTSSSPDNHTYGYDIGGIDCTAPTGLGAASESPLIQAPPIPCRRF